MPCSRCNGLLVAADLFDGIGGTTATRCTSCGDLTDAVILEHRRCWREPYSESGVKAYDPSNPRGHPLA